MTIKRRRQNDELLELLRRGDPAAGDRGLGAEETARLRRRVVSEASASKTPAFRPIPALAASAVLVLLVAVGWNLMRPELPPPVPGPAVTATDDARPERRTRQVQFSTPGGTRVIWLLDSEFGV